MNETILLVEDDENDVFFTKRAFKEAGIVNPVQVAQDGKEAMDRLSGGGEYADRGQFPLPHVVLLDLKLPQVMGLEVLKWVREQPGLKNLIVIILSSSQVRQDIDRAYQFGANAFLVKPTSPTKLREMAAGIKLFWLDHSHGPAMGRKSAELIGCGA